MKKHNNLAEISIQTDDFSLADEVALLEQDNLTDGAVVTFTGRVRNHNNGNAVTALTLEHYPGMTEKSLANIIKQAKERWHIGRVKVIHRIGELSIGDQIVFVGVTSKHRQDAFAANEFIMDYLKVSAPFWKKEKITNAGKISENWLAAKDSDNDKAKRWS
ncbi:molybdopterin synthase catalytic subunit MoaE [Colwellia ponticola]|uniref:Molybdopterin synthase catalytic subunit n=1 Tax=Colwellia ponticola TaxID=2304625 RepID=A0A8H2JPU9_9GAMM|nr:molybdopterin synthase catalytic subunit MoaE [Colwellia ponticola]RGP39552.1 Molybdopterin synthase [Altererythrobacter insulae]TMM47884.1 molybdopterin synthase catalytic subunit MoaE [Colwellia ponticola]